LSAIQYFLNNKGEIMSPFEMISVIVGLIALLISAGALVFNGIQIRQASMGLNANQQLERGTAVLHFTSRFFDLVKEGRPEANLANPKWAYEFWSLHTSEFYFFHHGILPVFMYTLWMMDLVLFRGKWGTEQKKSC
jgi:hypothetical protein